MKTDSFSHFVLLPMIRLFVAFVAEAAQILHHDNHSLKSLFRLRRFHIFKENRSIISKIDFCSSSGLAVRYIPNTLASLQHLEFELQSVDLKFQLKISVFQCITSEVLGMCLTFQLITEILNQNFTFVLYTSKTKCCRLHVVFHRYLTTKPYVLPLYLIAQIIKWEIYGSQISYPNFYYLGSGDSLQYSYLKCSLNSENSSWKLLYEGLASRLLGSRYP